MWLKKSFTSGINISQQSYNLGVKKVPKMLTESCMHSALKITSLRSSGVLVTAKSDPIFTMHEVYVYNS